MWRLCLAALALGEEANLRTNPHDTEHLAEARPIAAPGSLAQLLRDYYSGTIPPSSLAQVGVSAADLSTLTEAVQGTSASSRKLRKLLSQRSGYDAESFETYLKDIEKNEKEGAGSWGDQWVSSSRLTKGLEDMVEFGIKEDAAGAYVARPSDKPAAYPLSAVKILKKYQDWLDGTVRDVTGEEPTTSPNQGAMSSVTKNEDTESMESVVNTLLDGKPAAGFEVMGRKPACQPGDPNCEDEDISVAGVETNMRSTEENAKKMVSNLEKDVESIWIGAGTLAPALGADAGIFAGSGGAGGGAAHRRREMASSATSAASTPSVGMTSPDGVDPETGEYDPANDPRSVLKVLQEEQKNTYNNASQAQSAMTFAMNQEMDAINRKVDEYVNTLDTSMTEKSDRLDKFVKTSEDLLVGLEEMRHEYYGSVNTGMEDAAGTMSAYERDARDAARIYNKQASELERRIKKEARDRETDARQVLGKELRSQMKDQRKMLKGVTDTFTADKDLYREKAKGAKEGIRKAASNFQRQYRVQKQAWKAAARDATKLLTKKKQAIDRMNARADRLNEGVDALAGADNEALDEAKRYAIKLGNSFKGMGEPAIQIKAEKQRAESNFNAVEKQVQKMEKKRIDMAGKTAKDNYIAEVEALLKAKRKSVREANNKVKGFWDQFMKMNNSEEALPINISGNELKLQYLTSEVATQMANARNNAAQRQASLKTFVRDETDKVLSAVDLEDRRTMDIAREIRDRSVKYRGRLTGLASAAREKFRTVRNAVQEKLTDTVDGVDAQLRTVGSTQTKLRNVEHQMDTLANGSIPTQQRAVESAMMDIEHNVSKVERGLQDKVGEALNHIANEIKRTEGNAATLWQDAHTAVTTNSQNLKQKSDAAVTKGERELSVIQSQADESAETLQRNTTKITDVMNDLEHELNKEKDNGQFLVDKLDKKVQGFVGQAKMKAAVLNKELADVETDSIRDATNGMKWQEQEVEKWSQEATKLHQDNIDALTHFAQQGVEDAGQNIGAAVSGADQKTARFENYFKQVKEHAKTIEFAGANLAKQLKNSLAMTQHRLQAGNIALVESKHKQEKLLGERAAGIQRAIKAKEGRIGSAAVAQMERESRDSEQAIKEIMRKEHMTDQQRKQLLAEEENRLQKKLRYIEGRVMGAQTQVDELVHRQGDAAAEMSGAVDAQGGDVKTTDTAESMAKVKAGQEENKLLFQEMTDAQQAVYFLDTLKGKVKKMLADADARWEERLQLATEEMTAGSNAEMKTVVSGVQELVSESRTDGDELLAQIRQMDAKVLELSAKLKTESNKTNSDFEGELQVERDATDNAKDVLTSLARTGLDKLLNMSATLVNEINTTGTKMNTEFVDFKAKRAQHRVTLDRLGQIEGVADVDLARTVAAKGTELQEAHHSSQTYLAGFGAHDAAFKRLVFGKMKDLGYELDMDEVNAASMMPNVQGAENKLDAEVGAALQGEQARLSAELAAIYAQSDEKVAAVMRDMSLTEDERRAKVAEIEAEARARASGLFREQQRMREREAALEAQLARYATLVAEAEGKAEEAVASGHLSPEALGVTADLKKAGQKLQELKRHPIFSALEVGDASRADALAQLQRENAKLRQEDATMEREIAELEAQLP